MKRANVEKICEALLSPLGFQRTQTGWKRSMESYTITAQNTKMNITLAAENLDVPQQAIKHIAGSDAPVHLRRKLGRIEKMALRASRAQKRAKRQAILDQPVPQVKKSPEEGPYFGYASLKNFHPVCYCQTCKQMFRANYMESEDTCIGCSSGKEGKHVRK